MFNNFFHSVRKFLYELKIQDLCKQVGARRIAIKQCLIYLGICVTLDAKDKAMGRRADHTPDELRQMALDAAREIVLEKGLQGLTTRAIAKQIDYTVGTLYQVFDNADHLIEQMNIETMNDMHSHVMAVNFNGAVEIDLRSLVERYVDFTQTNGELWRAIIDHNLPANHQRSELYFQSVGKLLEIVEQAIAPLFGQGEEAFRKRDANLLWASLYGITALASAERLARDESTTSLSDLLIETYLKAKRG